jgi:hypothetical protein
LEQLPHSATVKSFCVLTSTCTVFRKLPRSRDSNLQFFEKNELATGRWMGGPAAPDRPSKPGITDLQGTPGINGGWHFCAGIPVARGHAALSLAEATRCKLAE